MLKIRHTAAAALAIALGALLMPAAHAADDAAACEAKAVSKDGKPLAGAAKSSFMKKCTGGSTDGAKACEAKAVSKDGKPLAGAAKTSFMKKCQAAG